MITNKELHREKQLTKSLRNRFLRELKKLPEGELYMKKCRGTYRPYQRVNGKEHYLNRHKTQVVVGLANRKELRRAIRALERNTELLEMLEKDYTDIPDLMPDYMSIAADTNLPIQKRTMLMSREAVRQVIERWKTEHNGNTDYMPEKRIHRTSDGVLVRSKSELVIYEYLKANGISFVYEKPVQLGDGIYYPDFTLIRNSDGKVFLWEHLGMMNDPSYFSTNIRKIYEYMDEGYLPFREMIYSFDYEDGSIDLQEVDRILRGFGFIE